MKKRDVYTTVALLGLLVAFAVVVFYATNVISRYENAAENNIVCIEEDIPVDVDEDLAAGRMCFFDIDKNKVVESNVNVDNLFSYTVKTEDYERIINEGMSEEEIKDVKGWKAYFDDPHPEVCEIFYKDGKVIGHHHTVDGKIVPATKECGVKIEVEGQSLEGAYHVINLRPGIKEQSK